MPPYTQFYPRTMIVSFFIILCIAIFADIMLHFEKKKHRLMTEYVKKLLVDNYLICVDGIDLTDQFRTSLDVFDVAPGLRATDMAEDKEKKVLYLKTRK